MIGNALGYEHREFEKLQRLQERLSHASRCDRRGEKIEDYQTVNLGQDFMQDDRAWTTRNRLEERAGASGKGTHIRHRDYWADAAHTVAVTFDPDGESPTLNEVGEALRRPERPLFIGRKTCLPADSLYLGRLETPDLKSALRRAPLAREGEKDGGEPIERPAWWPVEPDTEPDEALAEPVTDRRDWENQIHVGERWIAHGTIEVEPTEVSDE